MKIMIASDIHGDYQRAEEIQSIFNRVKKRNIRCDRLMIKDNHAIIIDYKFGKINEEYEDQIRNYISVVKNMGYENVDGYLLYFPDCNCIKVN